MNSLHIYNAAKFNNAKDAAKAGELFNVDGTSEVVHPEQLEVIMDSINKVLTFAGSAFAVVVSNEGLYYTDFEWVTDELALDFEDVRDSLPFMADLLRDSGGQKSNPKLYADMCTALEYLAGLTVHNERAGSLARFLKEVRDNG